MIVERLPEGCKVARTVGDALVPPENFLGWTARELFGVHTPPERPTASYRRPSIYEHTGLVWLLQGRPMVALTAETAAIQAASGGILTDRKHNKPALGPVGDGLDDFDGVA